MAGDWAGGLWFAVLGGLLLDLFGSLLLGLHVGLFILVAVPLYFLHRHILRKPSPLVASFVFFVFVLLYYVVVLLLVEELAWQLIIPTLTTTLVASLFYGFKLGRLRTREAVRLG